MGSDRLVRRLCWAFDPYEVSDLLVGLAAGILVPVWAILLARGMRVRPDARADAA